MFETKLGSLVDHNPNSRAQSEAESVNIIWYVFFSISCVLTLLYSIGLYFTYFDDPKEFNRTF